MEFGHTSISMAKRHTIVAPSGNDLAKNPLLLPSVPSERGDYVKLRRDLASLIPKLCGETVTSIRHKSQMTRSQYEQRLLEVARTQQESTLEEKGPPILEDARKSMAQMSPKFGSVRKPRVS